MTKEAFDQFLSRLNSDRESARKEYKLLRHALIVFFEQHGGLSPENLADETLNRVAGVLSEGARIDNLNTYTLAVARQILRENWHSPQGEVTSIGEVPLDQNISSNPKNSQRQLDPLQHEKARLECMRKCLKKLPAEDHRLIRKYYITEYFQREEHRKNLADQMSLSLNALRVRILDIRAALEVCLNECMG